LAASENCVKISQKVFFTSKAVELRKFSGITTRYHPGAGTIRYIEGAPVSRGSLPPWTLENVYFGNSIKYVTLLSNFFKFFQVEVCL